jgi:phosphonate metabolism-associated iron-containing alcohol dehydrogenase
MENYHYFMPTQVYFGGDYLAQLDKITALLSPRRMVLVSGEHFKKKKEYKKIITKFESGLEIFQPPIKKSSIEIVNRLTDFCRIKKPDLIITVGGGTIIDSGKAAALLAKHAGSIEDFLTKKKAIKNPGVPLVAVPTTAGTGTEVTPFTVIWDTKKRKKHGLTSSWLYPKFAVVDPQLTKHLPPDVTAYTGMDALTQAIEAYWSKNHNSISDVFALRAVKLAMDNLAVAVNQPKAKSREAMSLASLMAGLAFSNTKTTICHAVSYPITARWEVPHGHAVALTLPAFVRFSLPVLKQRERSLLEAMGAKSSLSAAKKITALMKRVRLTTKLSRLGIQEKDLEVIIKEGFDPDRAVHAPWVPSPKQLGKILKEIL